MPTRNILRYPVSALESKAETALSNALHLAEANWSQIQPHLYTFALGHRSERQILVECGTKSKIGSPFLSEDDFAAAHHKAKKASSTMLIKAK